MSEPAGWDGLLVWSIGEGWDGPDDLPTEYRIAVYRRCLDKLEVYRAREHAAGRLLGMGSYEATAAAMWNEAMAEVLEDYHRRSVMRLVP
jgi:hypothetical protein